MFLETVCVVVLIIVALIVWCGVRLWLHVKRFNSLKNAVLEELAINDPEDDWKYEMYEVYVAYLITTYLMPEFEPFNEEGIEEMLDKSFDTISTVLALKSAEKLYGKSGEKYQSVAREINRRKLAFGCANLPEATFNRIPQRDYVKFWIISNIHGEFYVRHDSLTWSAGPT